jgi:hypothetical protein
MMILVSEEVVGVLELEVDFVRFGVDFSTSDDVDLRFLEVLAFGGDFWGRVLCLGALSLVEKSSRCVRAVWLRVKTMVRVGVFSCL